MAYRAYPLLDFDGLRLEKEAWLTPGQSFRQLDNCYVHRGRLRKRPGATWMHTLGEAVVEPLVAGSTNYSGTLANIPYNVPHFNATRPIANTDYNVRFVGVNSVSGTMTIVIGAIAVETLSSVTFTLVDEGTTSPARGTLVFGGANDGVYSVTFPAACNVSIEVQYEAATARPVVGFGKFIDTAGVEYDLCFDTRRAWLYDAAEGWWYNEEPGLGDIWTGSASDLFWCRQFDDILVINNGVDPPYKFDPTAGTTLAAMATDIDGDASDDIDAAKMFWNVRGYGVYLGTTENGTAFPGRARWTQNGDAETFESVNAFLDAPENDVIVTAAQVAGELYVGFRETGWWRFRWTGDELDPFAWEPLESYLGAVARGGSVSLADRLLSRTRRGFVAVNRMGEAEIAPQLGDRPLEWSQEQAQLTQAIRVDERRQVWWSVADAPETVPGHIVVLQQEQDGSEQWSEWHVETTAFGTYRTTGDLVWDDIYDVIDTLEWRMDSGLNVSGFGIVIHGTSDGKIRHWRGSPADSATQLIEEVDTEEPRTAIEMVAQTGWINPFPGQRARLGWIDILADETTLAGLEIRLYEDHETNTFQSISFDLETSGAATGKVQRRARVNRIAHFFRFEVRDATKAAVSVDYLAPYFQPVGRFRVT